MALDPNFEKFLKAAQGNGSFNPMRAGMAANTPAVPTAQPPQAVDPFEGFSTPAPISAQTSAPDFMGVPDILNPAMSTGDITGPSLTGRAADAIYKSSVFADRGPSQAALNIRSAIDGNPRNFPEVPMATAADFEPSAPVEAQGSLTQPQVPSVFGAPTSASGIGTGVVSNTNFLQEGLRQAQGMTPSGQAAPEPQAPTGGLIGFQPKFPGQTPSQFMRGEDTQESTTFQGTDYQGRLTQFASPEARQANLDAGRAGFAQASADREARIDQNFGQARGPDSRDSDRRGTMTMEDATQLTGGNRDEARAMIERQKQGLGEFKPEQVERKGLTSYQSATLGLKERELEAKQEENNKKWAASQAEKDAEISAGMQETTETITKERDRLDSQLGFLTDNALKMSSLQDWSTEGIVGWMAEKVPFKTKAAQVNRLATSFQGNAFLRSIIDSKSLGATFGALSDTEGTKITAADAILMDTKMGNKERMEAAKQIIDTISSARDNAIKRLAKSGGNTSSNAAPQSGNVPNVEGVTITRIS